MTDYLNPDKLYPDDINRRIDIPPGFDSVRTPVKKETRSAYIAGGNMTAEQFLNSIRHLDNEINALDIERCRWMDRRQDLLDSAERHGGLTGVVVQHAVGSRTESIGIQLADMITPEQVVERINRYQQRINRRIDRLVDRKARALAIIDSIDNTAHRALLLYRYINGLQWATVADLMSYDPDYVRNGLRLDALASFETAQQNATHKHT